MERKTCHRAKRNIWHTHTHALSERKLNIFHTHNNNNKWHHNSHYMIGYYLFTPIITGEIEKCTSLIMSFFLISSVSNKRFGLLNISYEERRSLVSLILSLFLLLCLPLSLTLSPLSPSLSHFAWMYLLDRIGGCHMITPCAVLHVLLQLMYWIRKSLLRLITECSTKKVHNKFISKHMEANGTSFCWKKWIVCASKQPARHTLTKLHTALKNVRLKSSTHLKNYD